LKWVLGSQSPRRLDLLKQIAPPEQIEVLPPLDSTEPGFEGLSEGAAIKQQLLDIARSKCDDVLAQLSKRSATSDDGQTVVVTADTVIVATDANSRPIVLGKPPEDKSWTETVREWFQTYYFGRTHTAATAVCLARPGGGKSERVVETQVTFDAAGSRWLDWYLETGEPRGKAGGYAIQGAGGLFVSKLEGSLSNVVGLPLRELLEMLSQFDMA